MNIQDVLAANVQAIIDASGMNENSFAAHFKLPKSNLRKMRLSEANMRMSTVEEVAVALRLRACDLLDPDLARRAATGEPLRMGEPRPPVMADDQWRALSPRARAFVEDLCLQAAAGTLTDADIAWLHDSLNRASNTRRPAAETSAFAGKPPPAPEPGAPPRKTGDFFHT
jgi:hypothetical protein